MVTSILALIESVLSIANTIIKRKYINRVNDLKRAYYEEYNKPADKRSDAVLDNLVRELCIACESLAADLRIQNPSDISA